jgi:hypothetical protein
MEAAPYLVFLLHKRGLFGRNDYWNSSSRMRVLDLVAWTESLSLAPLACSQTWIDQNTLFWEFPLLFRKHELDFKAPTLWVRIPGHRKSNHYLLSASSTCRNPETSCVSCCTYRANTKQSWNALKVSHYKQAEEILRFGARWIKFWFVRRSI